MPELIILCAGAACDRASDSHDPGPAALALEMPDVADELARGAYARALAAGRALDDRQDEDLVPLELPHEAWLRRRFAVPDGDAIEAWSAVHHRLALPCWRLTPAHVQVGRDQLMLTDPGTLALTPPQAQALVEAAQPLFAELGMHLSAPAALQWFAAGGTRQRCIARSWTMACGRSIDAYWPDGADARAWRRLLTEVQMTWFDHRVNRERERSGLPAVNALWLDGIASAGLPACGGTVFTREPAIAGLAQAAACAWVDTAAPALDCTVLSQAAARGDALVDVDAWRAARRGGDAIAWRAAWRAFDGWCARIGAGHGPPAGFERIRFVLTGERRCLELSVGQRARWRFWHRFDAMAATLRP